MLKQARASTVREVRPHELRKTVIVRLSYEGEASAIVEQRLVVEYFVPGARWTPTYICRLDSAGNQATIAVRALICQRTGEDWSGVRLELSTAEPMAWCELPELPSLRLGRAQSVMRKLGWRLPPIGAEILFEDFDRHKRVALASVSKHQFISGFSSVFVPAIPNLIRKSELVFDSGTQNTIVDTEPSLNDVFGITQPASRQSSSRRRGTIVRNEVSPFGKSLIAAGYVDTNQMHTALEESRKTGRSLIEILEAMTGRNLSSDLLRQYKKQQLFELKLVYGVEFLDPELNEISSHQVGQLIDTLLPIDICRRYRLVPISKSNTQPPTLLVAMVDPDNLDAQDDLNRILRPQGITLQPRVITQEDYQQMMFKYLDEKLAKQKHLELEKAVDVKQDLKNLDTWFEAVDEVEQVDVGGAEDAPVINLVNRILAKALQEGVSDIHVEPQENDLRIRFRKDGVLRQGFDPLPRKVAPAVAARLKIMANLDIAERRLPQSGTIRRMYQGRHVDFFISTVPARYGEKIVLCLQAPTLFSSGVWIDENSISDRLAYGFMRLGAADELTKRGKLSIEQQQDAYLEILKRRNVVVTFDVMEVVQQAISIAQKCIFVKLPPGGINVREVAGSFDYAYSADGRIDVPSDGEFHSVALTSSSTDVSLRYVVVPREDTNVFRIAQLKNPLQAPLLAGAADVYIDGEYILSTNITTVPLKGKMELGLGVEQAIKVARNTAYQEARSNKLLLAFNKLRHLIKIDIANRLSREARIEVLERLPIPEENAKVEVQIDRVSPNWEKYEQQERGKPIRGGYRWRVQVPAGGQTTLSVQYTVKKFVDSELIGGNRRE